jgi:hypothetical protein
MPHIIRKVREGWMVSDAKKMSNGRYKNYSEKAFKTEAGARKQLIAINLSLIKKGEKVVWK